MKKSNLSDKLLMRERQYLEFVWDHNWSQQLWVQRYIKNKEKEIGWFDIELT